MNRSKRALGRAEACANIALAKYWGKSDKGDNLTAVPSLSLTLDALCTRTEVEFVDGAVSDVAFMQGEPVSGRSMGRVVEMLDRIRNQGHEKRRAIVKSYNNFPTAAGLASSASGFAALALAAARAADLPLSPARLSSEARKSSASAARSLYGGFAELLREADEATPLYPPDYWQVAMLVAVVSSGKKPIGSTGGMLHTKATSPFYQAWEASAPSVFSKVKAGVESRDFELVAESMEHSTRLMHATMITAVSPVFYLRGTTVELMHEVEARRRNGYHVGYTMDAGPNVKVLTTFAEVEATRDFLTSFPGVERVIVCRPGPAACALETDGQLLEAVRDDQHPGGVFEDAELSQT
jgi:diphosphomevalonate decarboxylase